MIIHMLKINLNEKSLFGNDAGEDENQEILQSYYVGNDDFDDFYDKDSCLSVVSARKGMGKSTLLSHLDYELKNNDSYENPIVVRVTGNSLLGLGDFSNKDQAYLENYWKQIICKEININIGNNLGIALTSDEMSLVEISELEGMKSKNFVGSLVSRLVGKIPLIEANLNSSCPENLESLLKNYLEKSKTKSVWLLVDDIDAKYIDNEEYQHRVGSFFSAIRSLAHDVSSLNIRATVRTDVWTNLRHIEDLDKWNQYVIDVFWTKRQLRDMLAKRILSFVQRKHSDTKEAKYTYENNYNNLFKLVFISPIKWAGEDKPIFDAINAFSNHKPRSMGQLCRMAASQAHKSRSKVSLKQINEILGKFGQNRRDDLIKEHAHQFIELENLINSFRAGSKEYKFSQLCVVLETKFIKGRAAENIPEIDGSTFHEPADLGNFIYKIGLISKLHDDGKTFTSYPDDPDLFNSQENKQDSITWSIHPSYRTFLNIS
jgi:hypothetical protein